MLKAGFDGATLQHERRHFSRAVFEGISFGLLDCMGLLRNLGADADEIRVTSGGAKSKFWVQMLSDMFNRPCVVLECDEGPAYGAALLAGVGIGVWPDVKAACQEVIRIKSKVQPQAVDYSESYRRYQQLYQHLKSWKMPK